MIITVDSNIIISALINSKGTEFSILQKKYKHIDFVSTAFLIDEIENKIKKVSLFTNSPATDLQFQFDLLTGDFIFVKDTEIDTGSLAITNKLMKGLDIKDYLFVAVTVYFEGLLWTGDLRLKRGLKRNGFNNVVTTSELKQIIKGL